MDIQGATTGETTGLRLSKTENACSLSLGDELPEGVLDDSPNGADAGWLTGWLAGGL
jgi:hypothetical protein